jgi:hypothetical protein
MNRFAYLKQKSFCGVGFIVLIKKRLQRKACPEGRGERHNELAKNMNICRNASENKTRSNKDAMACFYLAPQGVVKHLLHGSSLSKGFFSLQKLSLLRNEICFIFFNFYLKACSKVFITTRDRSENKL